VGALRSGAAIPAAWLRALHCNVLVTAAGQLHSGGLCRSSAESELIAALKAHLSRMVRATQCLRACSSCLRILPLRITYAAVPQGRGYPRCQCRHDLMLAIDRLIYLPLYNRNLPMQQPWVSVVLPSAAQTRARDSSSTVSLLCSSW
jgi:hypothetical protein